MPILPNLPMCSPSRGTEGKASWMNSLSYVENPPALTEGTGSGHQPWQAGASGWVLPRLRLLHTPVRQALKSITARGCPLMIRRAPSAAQLTPEMQGKMLQIENCLHCGKCKSKCPYNLDTPALLERNLKDYKEILAGRLFSGWQQLQKNVTAKVLNNYKNKRPGIKLPQIRRTKVRCRICGSFF